ncbi:MAG: SRPBCC family protein [Candidatus Hodarchaeota archaeon]
MGRFEKSIVIKAPPEKVWEMLAFDKGPEWMGDLMMSAEYTSEVQTLEDKFKVGATAHTRTHSGIESDVEITKSLENEKMTSRTTSRTMTAIGTYTLKPTKAGTLVSYVMDYEFHTILWKVFEKLVAGRMIAKDSGKSLEKLKSLLEQ